jgi:hypothetical protein
MGYVVLGLELSALAKNGVRLFFTFHTLCCLVCLHLICASTIGDLSYWHWLEPVHVPRVFWEIHSLYSQLKYIFAMACIRLKLGSNSGPRNISMIRNNIQILRSLLGTVNLAMKVT